MLGTRLLLVCMPMLGMVLVACGDSALFQAPPRGGSAAPEPEIADSVFTLVATVPYKALVEAAEAKIPKSMSLSGSGHIACLKVPHLKPGEVGTRKKCFDKPYVDFRGAGMERVCINVPYVNLPSIGQTDQCADYSWNANVRKDGPIRIGRSGSDLRAEQNIHITGKAGVKGDLAGLLSLNGKNIDVRLAPAVKSSLALDKEWCPLVKVEPIGRWVSSATVEIVGKNCIGINLGPFPRQEICAGPVNLGLADVLNGEFDKRKGDLQQAAQGVLTCATVRDAMAKQWHPFSIKVDRPGQPPLFLNIDPKSAGTSGLIVEDQGIKIAVQVGAKTVLSTTEIAPAPVPLPPLEKINASRGSLDVNLKVTAPYEFLKDELARSLKGKLFKKDVARGKVEVRIEDVDVYPSDGAVVIGLKIDADTPGRWFNTKGWVYLLGKPRPAPGGKGILVDDIGFATVVDSDFWKVAQSIFQVEVLESLKGQAKLDLSKDIDKASSEITAAIAKADLPGAKVTAGPPSIALTNIYVAPDALSAVVKLSMNFDLEITAAILK